MPRIDLSTKVEWKLKTYKPKLDLPPPILTRVASITVHWAYAEFLLAGMQYSVHFIDRKTGRDYSLEPRLKDVLDDISTLGRHRGLDFPFQEWETFTGTLTECDKDRNRLVHAIWFEDDDKRLCIQDIKGAWPKDANGIVRSKHHFPGSTHITEEWLDTRLQKIKDAMVKIRGEFAPRLETAAQAWRDKR
jgi:hypothetical protein